MHPAALRRVPRRLAAALLFASTAALALPGDRASPAWDDMLAAHRDAGPGLQRMLHGGPVGLGGPGAGEAGGGWLPVSGDPATAGADRCPALLRHSFTPIQGGEAQSLCQFEGKVVLVVNTASQCGFTGQYEGLEALYRKYRARGLVVVGFPSDDFGGQEPGSNPEIAEFCRTKYGVQFPLFEKRSVARLGENPFYADLARRTGDKPRWNFHKYLIDRHGQRVQSFASSVAPGALVPAIERLLAERMPASAT
jgi:glutathione peroxidase